MIYESCPFPFNEEAENMFAKRLIQLTLVLFLLAACLAFPRHASASGACASTYVVQPGDWLSKIAARCGVTLSALYAANPWVAYYYYIYPGQVLVIPGGSVPVPGPVPGPGSVSYACGPMYSAYYGNYYVVCPGDTLGGIAQYYGENFWYMAWHNGISNPNWIYAGQFIWP
jgi:lysozyme